MKHFIIRMKATKQINSTSNPKPNNSVKVTARYPQRSMPKTLYAIRRRQRKTCNNAVLSMLQNFISALKST